MKTRSWIALFVFLGAVLSGSQPWAAAVRDSLSDLGVDVHGFADVRAGTRLETDTPNRDTSLGEMRLQLDLSRMGDWATWQVKADFLYDGVAEDTNMDLETGKGWVDLREANVLFSPVSFADVKIGRQILTWGTGDLVFLNDLFPKDWQAFFLGRDEDYLKAPSDAVFVSLFPAFANIDISYTPQFDPDRYVRGERLSYWNPMLGRQAGLDAVVDPEMPDRWFKDDEWAVRISRNIGGYELALYGYDGFWKSPNGMDAATLQSIFPDLSVYGASIRGTVLSGIASMEAAYYDSHDDSDGDDPLIPNSEWRFLAGFEREIARELTAGVQYYVEAMADYDAYERSLAPTQIRQDRARHTVTLRLTKLLLNQDLTASLFVRTSLGEQDVYVRPTVSYKISDALETTVGANIFAGREDYTFLGQFERNTNVYASLRYSF